MTEKHKVIFEYPGRKPRPDLRRWAIEAEFPKPFNRIEDAIQHATATLKGRSKEADYPVVIARVLSLPGDKPKVDFKLESGVITFKEYVMGKSSNWRLFTFG